MEPTALTTPRWTCSWASADSLTERITSLTLVAPDGRLVCPKSIEGDVLWPTPRPRRSGSDRTRSAAPETGRGGGTARASGKSAREALASKGTASAAVRDAIRALDRAVTKGILHRNTA